MRQRLLLGLRLSCEILTIGAFIGFTRDQQEVRIDTIGTGRGWQQKVSHAIREVLQKK